MVTGIDGRLGFANEVARGTGPFFSRSTIAQEDPVYTAFPIRSPGDETVSLKLMESANRMVARDKMGVVKIGIREDPVHAESGLCVEVSGDEDWQPSVG
jgi:hypothetical protein